ncbi:MAG: EthD family reductase [Gammaproteobacteria bacterium]|nr:EthD family reductase [Gammaproteobacteria bacterium]MCY4219593.1 EthD family reductase [Gammaproteobacteria bacterium]MCY4276212.1 EthD family reductase [Gammaproteobacteria bacterium]
MFKAMIVLKRRKDLGFKEFQSHWLNHHATLVRQLPNIRKAVFNFSTEQGAGEVDAVSELWFDSQQDFLDAYASEIGQQVAQDSLSHVSKRERVMLTEYNIV